MIELNGDPGEIRTRDPQLRRLSRRRRKSPARTVTSALFQNLAVTSRLRPNTPLGAKVSDEQRAKILLIHSLPWEFRFWVRVVKRKGGCWEWIGPRDRYGYGRASRIKKPVRCHRYVWEQYNGPIPDGLCVLHSCDNPPCLNPAHLRLGTHQQNVNDRSSRGRGVVPIRKHGKWTGEHRGAA